MPYPCYCPAAGPACDAPFEYCDRSKEPPAMTDYAPQEFAGGTAVPEPDGWPFRHVALYCDADPDEGTCDVEVDADIRADTFEQALPGLRAYARTLGWQTADDTGTGRDLCPGHAAQPAAPEALLGVPGDEATADA